MSHVVGPRDSVLRSMRVLNGKSGEGGMFLWRFMGKLLARVTEIYGSNRYISFGRGNTKNPSLNDGFDV